MNLNIRKISGLVVTALIVLVSSGLFAQSASVSPSRLYFDVPPGQYKSQTLQVTNNGDSKESFQVSFVDFSSPGKEGKTRIDTAGTDHGCSQWLTASPSFFELEAGATQKVEILLQVPNTPEANSVRWAVTSVKIARENKGIENSGDVKSAMQIVQTFQFIIHIFQTPPTVTYKEAVINSFESNTVEANPQDSTSTAGLKLKMEVENTGDAIIDCVPVVDFINLDDGTERRVKQKGFTVLPGGSRNVYFDVPKDLSKGKYSALGWVDYGGDEVAGYEIILEIE